MSGRARSVWRSTVDWRQLRQTPYGMTPVVLLSLVGFFQLFDTAGFAVAGPDIVRDLGVSISAVIGIVQLVGLLSVFSQIGIGWLADRRRRLPFFTLGTVLSGLAAMGVSRAKGLVGLGLPRVTDDVSMAVSEVPLYSLLADYYPPESRGRVFALYGALRQLGQLIAPIAIGAAVVAFGWRSTFVAVGLPLVVLGLVCMVALKEPVRGYMERKALGQDEETAQVEDEPQSFAEGWRTVWAVHTLRRLFAAVLWGTGGIAIFYTLLGFYLAEHYGLNALQRAYVLTPAAVAGLVGAFLGGGLIDWLTQRDPGRVLSLFAVFFLVGALGIVGVAVAPPLPVLVAAAAVFSFGAALVGPTSGAVFAQVIPPSVRTQGLQFLGLAQLPALFLFLPMANQIYLRYGFESAILFGAPLLLVGAGIAASAGGFFSLDMRNAQSQATAAEQWRQARGRGEDTLLVCRDMDVSYGSVQVLFGVDLQVEAGEVVALLGTNGAGKSTLLRAVTGVQQASGGAVFFDGRDITHMPSHEIAARGVAHMSGGRGVFPGLTVREHLQLGQWLDHESGEAIEEVLQLFPVLRERADEQAGSLSGGEQQMLSLAQAFLTRPKLLLIDELSLGLAPAVVEQLLERVRELHRRGVAIILVEQSVDVALRVADRAVFLEKGEVRFSGDTAELRRRPDLLRAVYVRGTAGAPARTPRRDAADVVTDAVLSVEHVRKSYGGVVAVDDVSFDVGRERIVGLIGPNGAGKTTLFDLLSGHQRADAGTVRYAGTDITASSPEERARRRLVRRFQDARLFPSLTAHEVLRISLSLQLESRNPLLTVVGGPGARRAERKLSARADELLDLFGLTGYRTTYARELSTGVRRLLDLACVFGNDPLLLLLDEPTAGVAQSEAEQLLPVIQRIRAQTGCSILVIEHSMALLASIADELVALDRGRVIAHGRPDDVLNDPAVVAAYLGAAAESTAEPTGAPA